MPSDWCLTGRHDGCYNERERFYLDPKGAVVYTGETLKCDCKKRGCKCYVPPAERPKKKARKTRRKK